MAPSEKKNKKDDSKQNDENISSVSKKKVLSGGNISDTINSPIVGTENLEIARSGIQSSSTNEIPYMGIHYIFYLLNISTLLIILILLSIIINSICCLKYSPVKRKRNQIVQEFLKVNLQKTNEYGNFEKLKKDLENLRNDLDRRDKNILKKVKIGGNEKISNVQPLPIVKMDEEKLTEVFHLLAKMPSRKSNDSIDMDIKKKDVIVIGEDETVCVLNKQVYSN